MSEGSKEPSRTPRFEIVLLMTPNDVAERMAARRLFNGPRRFRPVRFQRDVEAGA